MENRVPRGSRFSAVSSVLVHLGAAAAVLISVGAPAEAQSRPVTFSADIPPLIYQHCATCHRPGGSSSVELLTYAAARAHARQIVDMTASRRMPPWQPEPGWGTFEGYRSL